jgi:hypothetical protein
MARLEAPDSCLDRGRCPNLKDVSRPPRAMQAARHRQIFLWHASEAGAGIRRSVHGRVGQGAGAGRWARTGSLRTDIEALCICCVVLDHGGIMVRGREVGRVSVCDAKGLESVGQRDQRIGARARVGRALGTDAGQRRGSHSTCVGRLLNRVILASRLLPTSAGKHVKAGASGRHLSAAMRRLKLRLHRARSRSRIPPPSRPGR